jgi:beta-glucosidase
MSLAIWIALAQVTNAAWDSSLYTSSPPVYPSPNTTGLGGWEIALEKARGIVQSLNVSEKASLVTGAEGPCTGNIPGIAGTGFGGLCLQNGPLGDLSADYASVFPAGLTCAASWDKALIRQRGVYIGSEFKDKGTHVGLGPVAGPLGRSAYAGRNWEGFSPDPYLTGKLFASTIEGMQSVGVQAVAKHLVGNEQETQRKPTVSPNGTLIESISSNIDDRTLHELYGWPFAEAVRSGVSSVMCSYNRLNQSYACQNSKLLNGMLKEELAFQGYVMSDWAATHSGYPAVLAGLDMACHTIYRCYKELIVYRICLEESRLRQLLQRILG